MIRDDLINYINTIYSILDNDRNVFAESELSHCYTMHFETNIGDYIYYFYYNDNKTLLVEKCDNVRPEKRDSFDIAINFDITNVPYDVCFYDTTKHHSLNKITDVFNISTEEEFFQNSTIINYYDLSFEDICFIKDAYRTIIGKMKKLYN